MGPAAWSIFLDMIWCVEVPPAVTVLILIVFYILEINKYQMERLTKDGPLKSNSASVQHWVICKFLLHFVRFVCTK